MNSVLKYCGYTDQRGHQSEFIIILNGIHAAIAFDSATC